MFHAHNDLDVSPEIREDIEMWYAVFFEIICLALEGENCVAEGRRGEGQNKKKGHDEIDSATDRRILRP